MKDPRAGLSRGVPGITERPRSIKSGRSLQDDLSIQYRSDLYMQEQYNMVAELQAQLRNALSDLTAAPAASLFMHEQRVDHLKTQCDEMIVVLQIVNKIDGELYFAREGLKKAIENGDSTLIHLRRKRVQWLEGKLEDIVTRSSASAPVSATTFQVDRLDTDNMESEAGIVSHSPEHAASGRTVIKSSVVPEQERLMHHDSETLLRPILLTETSRLTAASRAATSHVTIKSPKADGDNYDFELDDAADRPEDNIDAYWNSEHHRFEFSTLAPVMAKLDPNTLHQVALAVPGTYVGRPESTRRPDLPWREQGEDIHDIHREAFDRLSVQIHQMYDKVYDAAMFSVNADRASAHRAAATSTGSYSYANSASSGKNLSSAMTRAIGTSGSFPVTGGASRGGSIQDSALPSSANVLPPLQQDSGGARRYNTPHRIYYPKPIPPPQQLPLTRVNRDRNYPQPIATFAVPFNEAERDRPERLVNQGAMHDDTRLVIYKPSGKPRVSVTATSIKVGMPAATGAPVQQKGETVVRTTVTHKRQPLTAASMGQLATPFSTSQQAVSHSQDLSPVTAPSVHREETEAAATEVPASAATTAATSRKWGLSSSTSTPATLGKGETPTRSSAATLRPNEAEESRRKSTVPIKKTFNLALMMTKLRDSSSPLPAHDGGLSKERGPTGVRWDEVSSKAADVGHTGLRWERIKELLKIGLASPAVETRVDAAKQLGLLRCTDPAVMLSLKQQIAEDDDERVQYEAAKSLLSAGCLENEIIQIAVDYLIVGNLDVRLDIIKCLNNAKNIQYINKKMIAFSNLVKTLTHLCQNPDPDDPVSYEAAVCFGKLCVKNPHAVDKMKRYLVECEDTHKKAVTLLILIKQFNEGGWELVEAVLEQLTSSPVWEYRVEAAQLLQHLGRRYVSATDTGAELVYSILERRLWDDSQEMVRLECAKTLVMLDMYPRASETAIRQLSEPNETVRAHAVASLGTLGIKTNKIVRHLLEMLDLDPSDMVRRQVIRAFGALSLNDKRVVRALKERERAEGTLGSEAKRVLHKLESSAAASASMAA